MHFLSVFEVETIVVKALGGFTASSCVNIKGQIEKSNKEKSLEHQQNKSFAGREENANTDKIRSQESGGKSRSKARSEMILWWCWWIARLWGEGSMRGLRRTGWGSDRS
jgi:hypothetical protein